jgi:hypothetical protein
VRIAIIADILRNLPALEAVHARHDHPWQSPSLGAGTRPLSNGSIGSVRLLATQPGSQLLACTPTDFRQRKSWHSCLPRRPTNDNLHLIEEVLDARLVRVARAESNCRPEWSSGLRTGWFIAGTRSS